MPKRLNVPKELPENKKAENGLPADTARYVRLYLERIAMKLDRLAQERKGTYATVFRLCARIVRDAKPD